jgi:glycine cleavage system protein P-like pyridoxal-binding family
MNDVQQTAARMRERYGKLAHEHASYNYINNHGKNDLATQFWRAVADEIARLNRAERSYK